MAKARSSKPVDKKSAAPEFPLDIFPPEVKEAIEIVSQIKSISKNYLAVSYLVACGAAFDRKYLMRTPNNFEAFPALWVVIVGNAGATKSEPMNLCFQPFYKYTEEEVDAYEKAMEELPAKGSNMINGEKKKIPQPDVRITSNTTTESVIAICSKKNHGLLIHTDEIRAFVASMDAYRSGKSSVDLPFWLSAFSGSPYITTRKTTGTSMLKNTTISIMGSIQYGMLTEAFRSSRDASGFMDRFLFCCDQTDPPKWNLRKKEEHSPEELIFPLQNSIMEVLKDRSLPVRIEMEPAAEKELIRWQNEMVNEMTTVMSEDEVSTAKKDEIYINRFSLLIHLIKQANVYPPPDETERVGLESVKAAIRLMDYFKDNRDLVKELLQQQANEVNYTELLEEIRRAKGDRVHLRAIVSRYRSMGVKVRWFEEHTGVPRSTLNKWAPK